MENASKALLMAGGILIALLILTLIVYLTTSTSRVANYQDERREAEQLSEFNRSYEVYNKTRMYGTDIMTVVNKAIDYNNNLDADEEEYFINIKLELSNSYNTEIETTTTKADGTIINERTIKDTSSSLSSGTYYLRNRENSIDMNQNVLNFFKQSAENSYEEEQNGTKIIKKRTYSAISNFKTAIFKCKNVGYNNITGRINYMEFSDNLN